MKKHKRIGEIVAVPLANGGYCWGVIAHAYKNLILMHFTGPVFGSVDEAPLPGLESFAEPIYTCVTGLRGFKKGEWEVRGNVETVDPFAWEWPMFKLQEPLAGIWFEITYDDTFAEVRRRTAKADEVAHLPKAGVAGHKFVEKRLQRLLQGNPTT